MRKEKLLKKNSPNLMRLYRLVDAMTPTQKGDFRKYSRFWGASKNGKQGKRGKSIDTPAYVQLFDAVNTFMHNARKVETLQSFLETSLSISGRALADQAEYLCDGILESLRTTPDRGRLFNRLNSLMQDINTLYQKGLLADALLMIAHARTIARKLDKPAYLLELLWWQNRVQPKETERLKVATFCEDIRVQQEQIVRHSNQANELRSLTWILAAEIRQVDPDTLIVSERWRTLFVADLQPTLQTISGFRAKMFFLTAARYYSDLSSKKHPEQRDYWLNRMFETHELLITLYQSKDFAHFAQEEASMYWTTLENHITLCRRLGKHQRADEVMEIFEQEADEYLLIYSRLNRFIGNMEFIKAILYIEQRRIQSLYERYRSEMTESRQIIICYQCGFLYFTQKRWEEASRWFAYVIEGQRPKAHHVAVTLIGLLDILCSFEMNTYGGSISRLLENFEHRQKRAEQWGGFVEELTGILKDHLNGHPLEHSAERIEPLQKQVSQNKLLGMYGVVLAWIEARLNQTDYLTELKKYNG